MGTHKSKASKPQRQFNRGNNHLRATLTQLDDDLYNLLQSHQFYQQSVIALAETQVEPDYWLMGAVCTHRWLREQGERLTAQMANVKQAINP